jgi:hypothetical protein
LHYKFYNPSTGRWLNRDPLLEEAGGLNLYGMLDGNLVSEIDTDGQQQYPTYPSYPYYIPPPPTPKTYDFVNHLYPGTSSFRAGDIVIPEPGTTINVLTGDQWPFASGTGLAKAKCLLEKLGFTLPAPRNGVYLSTITGGHANGFSVQWNGFFGIIKYATFVQKTDADKLNVDSTRTFIVTLYHEMKGHNADLQDDSDAFDQKYEQPVKDAWDKLYAKSIPDCKCKTQDGKKEWVMRTELDKAACACGIDR